MMKAVYFNAKRYILIALAFCLMLLTSTFAVVAQFKAAAQGTIGTYECASFEMDGASVRVDKTYGGLRFVSKLKKSEAEAVPAGYSLQYGILAIPASLSTSELTVDNTTDDIMNLTIDTPVPTTDNGVDYYELRGVVSNIPADNYGTEVLGRGYASVVDANGAVVKTFYTKTLSRNIAYVGYKAQLEDSSLTESLKNYYNGKTFSAIAWDETLVSCDYDYAYAGQVINVTPVYADRVEEIKINNGEVDFNAETNTFVMPAGNVTVTVVKKAVDLSKDLSTQFNAWEANSGNGTIALGESFATKDGDTRTALQFTSDNKGVNADYNQPGDYYHLYVISIATEVMEAAKAAGYESITFTFATQYDDSITSANVSGRALWWNYSGRGRMSAANGQYMGRVDTAYQSWGTATVSLADLTNGTLAIASGGKTLYLTEVYLSKPVDLTADLSTDLRAWASNDSASTFAVEEFTTTDGVTKTALKWTSNNKSMSWGDTAGEWVKMYTLYIDQELIAKAIEEGYTGITFTMTGAGRLAYFNYSGSGYVNGFQGTNLLGRYNSNNGSDQWHTYEVALSSLTNGTLAIAGTTPDLYVTEVYFEGINLKADLSTVRDAWNISGGGGEIAMGESFATKDGVTKTALKFTSDNQGVNANNNQAGDYYHLYVISIQAELINMAKSKGYTTITFTFATQYDDSITSANVSGRVLWWNYTGTGRMNGSIYMGRNTTAHQSWGTATVSLDDLTNGTLAIASGGTTLYLTGVYFGN